MTSTDFLRRLAQATPENTPPKERAKLRRLARQLNLSCALPNWFHDTQAHPATASHLPRSAHETLQAKSQLTGYPLNPLALAYLRAIRDRPTPAPGMTNEDVAQARVNALIQLAELDPTAPTQDSDLLPLMQQNPFPPPTAIACAQAPHA